MSSDLPALDPGTVALLAMDFQPGIIARVSDGDALIARAAEAIRIARERRAHVGYVRVAFRDDDVARVPSYSRFAAMLQNGPGPFHADAPESQIDARLAPRPGDIVVRKTRVGPFSTTDLETQLKDRGVTTLILAGISTSGVVLSTVREAADRDYQLFVIADATADSQPDVHELLVTKVFPAQARIVQVADLEHLLTAPRSTG